MINLKTAKALGPTIPPSLLGRAMPAGGDAHAICGIGSWGGRCPSLADYVIGTRATSGEPAAGGHSCCLSFILATLEATAQVFGQREIVMAWEMTKQFKEILRGPAAARRTHFEAAPVRGGFTLIIPSSRFD